jgi:hypothetical protein
MKLILISLFLLSCGKSHSHKEEGEKKLNLIQKESLHLETFEKNPLELVLILKKEKLHQVNNAQKLDQEFKIKCLKTCKIKRKIK